MRTMRVFRLLLSVALVACGRGTPPVPPAPEVLLTRARTQFRAGDFAEAQQSLRRVIFELSPNDSTLPEVHYLLAETQFQVGQYSEASVSFRQVADQFPGSVYAPLALLRAGDANMRLWRKPELDPTYGQTALAIYQDLVGRYPDSQAATRAQLHVRQLREWFADKTYKNGLFYFRRRAYDSGIIYFKDVVANYPDTPRAADALLRLADSYRVIGYREELRETCAHVRRFYPQVPGLERSCPPDSGVGAR
ncbi:MAG: outer membrane protein assembly factor BamD [Gemmatimonadales bacterium]